MFGNLHTSQVPLFAQEEEEYWPGLTSAHIQSLIARNALDISDAHDSVEIYKRHVATVKKWANEEIDKDKVVAYNYKQIDKYRAKIKKLVALQMALKAELKEGGRVIVIELAEEGIPNKDLLGFK